MLAWKKIRTFTITEQIWPEKNQDFDKTRYDT